MDLSLPSEFNHAERAAHRVYGIDVDGSRLMLKNVYAATHSRTMYLSRVEKNRLAHSENGNTTYMSRKTANKLAHATNGNTAA